MTRTKGEGVTGRGTGIHKNMKKYTIDRLKGGGGIGTRIRIRGGGRGGTGYG